MHLSGSPANPVVAFTFGMKCILILFGKNRRKIYCGCVRISHAAKTRPLVKNRWFHRCTSVPTSRLSLCTPCTIYACMRFPCFMPRSRRAGSVLVRSTFNIIVPWTISFSTEEEGLITSSSYIEAALKAKRVTCTCTLGDSHRVILGVSLSYTGRFTYIAKMRMLRIIMRTTA